MENYNSQIDEENNFVDDVEEAPEPLTDEERARAIGHFNKHYVGHGKGITTFHKNTKNKHDRIVAKVTLHSDKKKGELVKRLNSKQDDFTYIYKNSYIIANPKNSNKKAPVKEGILDTLADLVTSLTPEWVLSEEEEDEAKDILKKAYKSSDHEYIRVYEWEGSHEPNSICTVVADLEDKRDEGIFELVNLKRRATDSNPKYEYTYKYKVIVERQLGRPMPEIEYTNKVYVYFSAYRKKDKYLKESMFVDADGNYCGDYTLEEMNTAIDDLCYGNPVIESIVDRGIPQVAALEMLEVAVMENPYLLVVLTPIDEEYEFTEENAIEYDDRLLYAFMDAYMLENMDIEKASILGRCNSYDQVAEGIVDTVRKVKREGEKAIDHIKSGRLSPVVAQLKDAIEEITGLSNEKKREMVVTGNGFIKARRLFFKILTMWFAKPLLFAALPGGPLMLLINIVVTVKGWANVYDEANGESEGAVKRQCIQELEMELKMTREKINDAKSKGDNKAKYQLMRLESRIEQEITRVKFGDPVEKRNLIVKKDPLRG